jgi:uncharacterized protein with HEPN domain
VPSKHDPADSIADIIENAGRIASHITGMDRDGFARNDLVRDAVERCLGRICEAAHRLGDHAGRLMPGQNWRDIRGMGNQLRHAYDRINVDIIWKVAAQDIPAVAEEARAALQRLGTNASDQA